MKVVCIDNNEGNSKHLDLWGIYDVKPEESAFPEHYIIKVKTLNKDGAQKLKSEIWVKKEKFVTLDDWRKIKIESLINKESDNF